MRSQVLPEEHIGVKRRQCKAVRGVFHYTALHATAGLHAPNSESLVRQNVVDRKPQVYFALVCESLVWTACTQRCAADAAASHRMVTRPDPNSFANPDEAHCRHLDLTFNVDFDSNVLEGTAVYTVNVLTASAKVVSLDTKGLFISAVSAGEEEGLESVPFGLKEEHAVFGQALHVQIPAFAQKTGAEFRLKIVYKTSPASTAIQWLKPEQTKGKKHPFLFTQCQAIHARTMVPCQDCPAAKLTYASTVSVPKELTAAMSALEVGRKDEGDRVMYSFNQPVPLPSYLIALVVGQLEKRKIGKRSIIYAEPEMMEACYNEFAEDTEKYVDIAERICGPYVWGVYGLVVLPPSFPYGGMENPCLTFVTPTLLAGDRSLTNVVAHEIAHSWMGNLVTNHTWEHFWLNEGFTIYLERRIMAHHSSEGEKMRDLCAEIGFSHLEESVALFGKEHDFTRLCPHLENIDPDDAFSSVPYEKGFLLLHTLEGIVGGPARMEAYLKHHCETFKFKTVTSSQFKDTFTSFFSDVKELDKVDWNAWFTTPGIPFTPKLDSTLSEECSVLADKWIQETSAPDASCASSWDTNQKLVFLGRLLTTIESKLKGDTTAETIRGLRERLMSVDSCFGLSTSNNAELRFIWYQLGLKLHVEGIEDHIVSFITTQGRMKFVRPLYRALYHTKRGKQLARDTFVKHRAFYHSIAAKMVERDLDL